ncbi:hypothetical protein [Rhizobium sophoriradicis]|uniref:NADP-dependent oxidoreductase domain-containing protein n=1 Tax=Rhizobium sophoriradicis TaxID=1535245 RepID=A0A2A5KMD7_9HYPH|nr:hypothetical protein [Rhizobium sophoriradicis]PCK78198.1 hypothetical protein CPT34_26135 [Rhizobium sophoriradicis]
MQSWEPGLRGLNITIRGLGTVNCKEHTTEAGLSQLGAALEASMNFVDAAEMCAVPSRVDTHRLEELYIGSWFPEDGIGLMDSLFVRSPAFRRGRRHRRAATAAQHRKRAGKSCMEAIDLAAHGTRRHGPVLASSCKMTPPLDP